MTLRCKSLSQLIKSVAIALLLATAISTQAFADCSNTSTPTCSYVPAGTSVCVTPTAFSSPSPASKKVYNGCALAIMVPTGTQAEWTSFVNNHESCASLSSCSSTSCNPSSVANGSVGSYPDCTVTCNDGYTYSNGNCVLDTCSPSSIVNGSVGSYPDCAVTCNNGYSYLGGACVPGPVNGACLNGAAYQCAAGTAAETQADGLGNFYWYCAGSNYGSNSGTCYACGSGYAWNGSSCVATATSCNPSSVANGSVGSYPSCTISCNSGYSWNGSSCIADNLPAAACGSEAILGLGNCSGGSNNCLVLTNGSFCSVGTPSQTTFTPSSTSYAYDCISGSSVVACTAYAIIGGYTGDGAGAP